MRINGIQGCSIVQEAKNSKGKRAMDNKTSREETKQWLQRRRNLLKLELAKIELEAELEFEKYIIGVLHRVEIVFATLLVITLALVLFQVSGDIKLLCKLMFG